MVSSSGAEQDDAVIPGGMPARGRPAASPMGATDALRRLAQPGQGTGADRWGRPLQRWLVLLLMLRTAATATAVTLLAVHRVTAFDGTLIVIVLAYSVLTSAALVRWPAVAGRALAWVVDLSVMYALVWVSGDWRSPFYLLALTSLALPAAGLGSRRATILGALYTAAYAVAAHVIGPDPLNLGTQASMESLAAHLVLPGMTCVGVGYAAETLRGLVEQRLRAERLAIEAERRRIAWELHDSAKQRVHAAHLVISTLVGADSGRFDPVVDQALLELQAASAEMDSSLAELQEPLLGRPLHEALAKRAGELAVPGGAAVAVTGSLADLPPLQAAHAYRIGAEALTNAVRHAEAHRIEVLLEEDAGVARLTIRDDGRGLPASLRPGSTGMMAMRSRARSIGGTLTVGPRSDGPGTTIELRFAPIRGEGSP